MPLPRCFPGLVLLVACESAAVRPAKVPHADEVTVRQGQPPPGATEVGGVEGTHGQSCMPGDRGTLEGALILVRNQAVMRGANFVSILSSSPAPLCRFTVTGLAYRVDDDQPPPSAEAADTDTCAPICSPGYVCSAGTCVAVCNPTCAAGQVCRPDRTCGPAR